MHEKETGPDVECAQVFLFLGAPECKLKWSRQPEWKMKRRFAWAKRQELFSLPLFQCSLCLRQCSTHPLELWEIWDILSENSDYVQASSPDG